MLTLYLHVGLKKTGTTTIQQLLSNLESREPGRPLEILHDGAGSFNLSRLATDRLHRLRIYDSQITSRSRTDTQPGDVRTQEPQDLVVSAESLSLLGRRRLKSILGFFRPNRVKILITTRAFEMRLLSNWCEDIRWGYTSSLAQYTREIGKLPKSKHSMVFTHHVIEMLRGAFEQLDICVACLPAGEVSGKWFIETLANWLERDVKSSSSLRALHSNRRMDPQVAIQAVSLSHVLRATQDPAYIVDGFVEQAHARPKIVDYFLQGFNSETKRAIEGLKAYELENILKLKPRFVGSSNKFRRAMEIEQFSDLEFFFQELEAYRVFPRLSPNNTDTQRVTIHSHLWQARNKSSRSRIRVQNQVSRRGSFDQAGDVGQ